MSRPGVPWRVVWLTLSEATGSPEEFWFFVTEALGRAGVDLPHSSRVAPMSPAGEGFVIRLATDLLEREEPVVLVLDEVERLTDPAVPAQLELLMRLAGLSLRLVLLSRVDPLLPLQRYRMAGAVTEIRTADLAFTTKEEIPLAVGCLGIWYAVRKGRRAFGLGVFGVGLAITLFDFLWLIPHFSPTGANLFISRYRDVGGTPGGMAHKLVTDPLAFVHAAASVHKAVYLLILLVPVLGLSLLEPLLLLGAVAH